MRIWVVDVNRAKALAVKLIGLGFEAINLGHMEDLPTDKVNCREDILALHVSDKQPGTTSRLEDSGWVLSKCRMFLYTGGDTDTLRAFHAENKLRLFHAGDLPPGPAAIDLLAELLQTLVRKGCGSEEEWKACQAELSQLN